MANLTDLYEDNSIPSSSVKKGMLLKISNSKEQRIDDGTIGKVTFVGVRCDEGDCLNDHGMLPNDCNCRRIIQIKATGRSVSTGSCFCTLHTLDGKLVVDEKKYYPRKRVVYE